MPIVQIIALLMKLVPSIVLIIQAAQDHVFTPEEIQAIIVELLKAFGFPVDAQGEKVIKGISDMVLTLSKLPPLKLPA